MGTARTSAPVPPPAGSVTIEGMEREVQLTVGGKKVPLNDFVRAMVANVVLGMVRSLKKADPQDEIVLRVGPQPGK